jgi:hypothetical protein
MQFITDFDFTVYMIYSGNCTVIHILLSGFLKSFIFFLNLIDYNISTVSDC